MASAREDDRDEIAILANRERCPVVSKLEGRCYLTTTTDHRCPCNVVDFYRHGDKLLAHHASECFGFDPETERAEDLDRDHVQAAVVVEEARAAGLNVRVFGEDGDVAYKPAARACCAYLGLPRPDESTWRTWMRYESWDAVWNDHKIKFVWETGGIHVDGVKLIESALMSASEYCEYYSVDRAFVIETEHNVAIITEAPRLTKAAKA
jgi:hypothetical protein